VRFAKSFSAAEARFWLSATPHLIKIPSLTIEADFS
jgi:hypothetical protein